MKKLLFALILLSLLGCNKNEIQSTAALTLTTGVEVQSTTKCLKDGSRDLIFKKIESDYLVSATDHFMCDAKLSNPYLTVVKNNQTTLVLNSENYSGCECLKNVNIKLRNRIEKNNVLYVINNSEVLGHVVVP
jgi:hypothetical protein